MGINEVYHDGRTALHLVAATGFWEIVSQLVAAGADPEGPDHAGGMPKYLVKNDNKQRYEEAVA